MPKTYNSVWIHLIWTTKNRDPLLKKDFRFELCSYIKENAGEKGYIVDMINGVEDHLHCLIRLLPAQSIAAIIKQIKGASSRWISNKDLLPVEFAWQQGYGALSVSPNDVQNIRSYIKNQEHHHKSWKLEEELKKFKYYNQE